MRSLLQKFNRIFDEIDRSNTDNLHLIAISNINSPKRKMERWWEKKYKSPLRQYEDHTIEELIVEYLEDFYDNNPQEIDRFLDSLANQDQEEWNGKMSEDHERAMQARWKKTRQIDLSKFQSDEQLSPEEEKALLDNLGKTVPLKIKVKNVEVDEEFDDNFLGDS